MTDEKSDSSAAPGGNRRRPPTTIDVRATEIASGPVHPTEPPESAGEPKTLEPQPAAGLSEDAKAETPRDPRPGSGTEPTPNELPPKRRNWRLIVTSAVGAAAVLLFALWASGAMSNRDDPTAILTSRLAALEKNVRDLAAKPAPAGVDQGTFANLATRVSAAEQSGARLGDLDNRVAKLEQGAGRVSDLDARIAKAEQAGAVSSIPPADPALTDRIAALEAATRPLGELTQRADTANAAARDAKARADAAFEASQKNSAVAPAQAADHKEIESLAARVAALEQAAKSAEERIARTAGTDRVGRLAFVAVALRSAVERGEPFAQELAAVKPLVPDAAAMAPLEPFAATGVPRTAALARELSPLTGPMLNAAVAARDGGIMDRLQQNAERLVRIRPVSEAPGDDPATVVTRAEVKATQGDLPGALAEVRSLPAPVRMPAQAWMAKAEAQIAALAAARALAGNAVGALGKAAP